ncbi:Uncharacterized protein GBIM_10930 [Gryllus bimaculatus]|nr:Uncharacterized protein GBIM_10930 [Gryllus bimaculatus]
MARTIKLNSGYEMPTIGLGTWQAAPGEVERAVAEAVDAGYRHFDCAMLYGNEREIGAALRAKMDEGAVRREDLFITSKARPRITSAKQRCSYLWNTFHRPEVVEATCRRSLEALQLDYLDLYLVHWPVAFKEGEEPWPRDAQGRIHTTYIEPASTWRAMERLPALGLARSVGVSNFNSQQLARLCDAAQLPPAVNQVECHPYLTQRALRAACRARGVTVVAYSPLGAPNAVRPATTEAALGAPAVLHDHRIKELAAKYAKSPAQIILRYLGKPFSASSLFGHETPGTDSPAEVAARRSSCYRVDGVRRRQLSPRESRKGKLGGGGGELATSGAPVSPRRIARRKRSAGIRSPAPRPPRGRCRRCKGRRRRGLRPLTEAGDRSATQVQSGMAAIPKSTNPTRLRENLDIYDFELAPAELQFIDTFNCGVRAYPLLEVQHDVNYPFHIE